MPLESRLSGVEVCAHSVHLSLYRKSNWRVARLEHAKQKVFAAVTPNQLWEEKQFGREAHKPTDIFRSKSSGCFRIYVLRQAWMMELYRDIPVIWGRAAGGTPPAPSIWHHVISKKGNRERPDRRDDCFYKCPAFARTKHDISILFGKYYDKTGNTLRRGENLQSQGVLSFKV